MLDRLFSQPLDVVMIPIQGLIFFITLYFFLISLPGLYRRPEKKVLTPKKTFAVVVAAHNEEAVIAPLVENLLSLNYPKSMFDVFVVADNCSDDTATISRRHGARVFERFDLTKKSKGYALEWVFPKIFALDKHYDAVVIFDADNLVKDNFLLEMNSSLCQGHKIIQAYIDAKNPNDNWVTGTFALAFWQSDRMLQLGHQNLGLTNTLGGTGMCIDVETLKRYGWGAYSLTEDLEFSVKALADGLKTSWAHDAVVYDEKASSFMQAWRQRVRWTQGRVDVMMRYMGQMFWSGIKTMDMNKIDMAIHLFQPLFILITTFHMLITYLASFEAFSFLKYTSILPIGIWTLVGLFQWFYPALCLLLDRRPLINYKWLIPYPLFIYLWVPITFVGFLRYREKEWTHTKHTRSMSYRDLHGSTKNSSASPAKQISQG